MSFLSLEKYLYSTNKPQEAASEVPPPLAKIRPSPQSNGFYELTGRVMESIASSVLAGEAVADLATEIDTLRLSLRPDTGVEVLASAAERFSEILRQFRDRLGKADEERAEDFRKVLSILNETFSHISGRNERSDTKFKYLEQSLQHVTKLDDLRSVGSRLSEVLQFVRVEATQEREAGQLAVEALGNQLRQAHHAATRFRVGLAGRDGAIDSLKTIQAESAPINTYVALFVADAVQSVRARHGSEVSDGLIDELGRKEIQALAPDGKVFSWTPSSILLVWQTEAEREYVRDIGRNVKSPFEYRTYVGSRMATFSIGLRSAVMQLQGGNLEEIVTRLDQFAGGTVC